MQITIQKTSDYSQFKTIKENRRPNKNHIARLLKSISKKSLMADMPILVDGEMNILDGQHRYEACKLIGDPIYFKVSQVTKMEDIPMLNNTTKRWTPEDYLNQYINQGNENYIKFEDFMKWAKMPSVSIAQKFIKNIKYSHETLDTNGGMNISTAFNTGYFIYPNNDNEVKMYVLKFCEVDKFCNPNKPYSRSSVIAYDILSQTEGFDHDRMVDKLKSIPVQPFNNASVLIDHLEKIYNHNMRKSYLRFNRA